MTPARRRERGSAVLYAVLLSPMLLLVLAFVIEGGALQLERQRLRSAVDEAALIAGGSAATGGGGAELDTRHAAAVLRTALADNLRPLAADMTGSGVDAVVAAADVVVVTAVPSADPFGGGAVVRRPTIEVRVRAPMRSGLLRFAGLPDSVLMTITAGADLRFAGAGSAP